MPISENINLFYINYLRRYKDSIIFDFSKKMDSFQKFESCHPGFAKKFTKELDMS